MEIEKKIHHKYTINDELIISNIQLYTGNRHLCLKIMITLIIYPSLNFQIVTSSNYQIFKLPNLLPKSYKHPPANYAEKATFAG